MIYAEIFKKLQNAFCIYLTSPAVSTLWINDTPFAKIQAVSVCGDVGVPPAGTTTTCIILAHLKACSMSNALCRGNDGAGIDVTKLFFWSLILQRVCLQHFIFFVTYE
jgi:hypothetical protein